MSELDRMIRVIEAETAATCALTGIASLAPRVLQAMRQVPRQHFVPGTMRRFAFDNGPLPIECGQTISQPFIVALMTDLLCPRPDAAVLEVGTGSGYQAAVLSKLAGKVYSSEIIPELADTARDRLLSLGYANVEVRSGDAYHGWAEHAPYDGIIVTAAAPEVPEPLLEELKPGGRLVIPVGPPYGAQHLRVVEKGEDGLLSSREVLAVAFVPITGERLTEGRPRPGQGG